MAMTARATHMHPRADAAPLILTLALALSGAGLVGRPPPAQGEMYRWVDETGTTVYSQSPPPGTPATAIKPDPPPNPTEVSRAAERTRVLIEQDINRREDLAHAAEAAAKKAAEQTAAKSACNDARKNLEILQKGSYLPVRTPDGKTQFLTPDDLAKRIAEANAAIKANCK
jgi:hypothetical protein